MDEGFYQSNEEGPARPKSGCGKPNKYVPWTKDQGEYTQRSQDNRGDGRFIKRSLWHEPGILSAQACKRLI
jgi:hypothetical protein